jgi:proteasome lid subunit RPN8/RPN11
MPPMLNLSYLPPCSPPCRLTFSPLAWLKLQYFCHTGDTEVGGFGISSERDLLYIEDFITVRQETTAISVGFLDNAVADFFDACVDRGLTIQQFSRVWCHTHPGDLATPSSLDEATFARCFGMCDWSLMFIVARSGQTYARLSFAAGPGGHILVPTAVAWPAWPDALHQRPGVLEAALAQWQHEYAENVISLPTSFQDLVRASEIECGWEDHRNIVDEQPEEANHVESQSPSS